MDPSTSELPTGTVTFLFSDVESSTRLVEELATSTFRELIEQHNSLLREIFDRNGGVERGTEGDGFLVVFADAPSALRAAVQAQRAIEDTEWPEGRNVRVRMGLHSGQGIRGGDDYVGSDIVRAARVASSAHGGQVLISDSTRALCQRAFPADVSVRFIGEHELKGIDSPERLYQLVIEGLPSEFPPPPTGGLGVAHVPIRIPGSPRTPMKLRWTYAVRSETTRRWLKPCMTMHSQRRWSTMRRKRRSVFVRVWLRPSGLAQGR